MATSVTRVSFPWLGEPGDETGAEGPASAAVWPHGGIVARARQLAQSSDTGEWRRTVSTRAGQRQLLNRGDGMVIWQGRAAGSGLRRGRCLLADPSQYSS